MKRNFIIRSIIIGILVIAIIVSVSVYFIQKNAKKYEIEKVNTYNYFLLEKNDLYGVIDRSGNIILDANYIDVKIPNPEKPLFVCYEQDSTKVLNESKEEILTNYKNIEPIKLQNISGDLAYEKSVLKYEQDGKYGLIDFTGNQIAKPEYEEISGLPYKEGELLVKQDNKCGVINIKGNNLVEIKYDNIEVDGYYTDNNGYKYAGYIVSNTTEEGYRYGYINYKGKLLLETKYNELSRIADMQDNENIYLIGAINGQYGVIKNKENVLNNEYQSIRYDANNNVLVVEKSKKFGISKLNGQIIVPVEYNQIDITGIYLYAQNEQGTTVYNNNGTQANVDSNIAILETENEKYRIRINDELGSKYGIIDDEGVQLIEEKYNYLEYLYDDYFIASQEGGKLGVINDKDEVKIPIECDSVQKIENTNLIKTVVGQTTTRIYKEDMQLACEMQNATIETVNDYIKVYNDTETKYLDKQGNEVLNTVVYQNNKIFASKNEQGKYGFVDKSNSIVVDYQYDKVTEVNEYGYAGVKKDGKWGVINQNGEVILEPTYELPDEIEPDFIGPYSKVTYGFGEFYFEDLRV